VNLTTDDLESGTLFFQCNVCGQQCTAELDFLGREVVSCSGCGSNPRIRAVIRALSTELLGKDLILPDFPDRRSIKGLGLTDWEGYSSLLAQKFDYLNTYLHQEPRLDISATDIPPERRSAYDFVISSEIFEHVVPPVEKAFQNVVTMLKPGGLFVLTVPYGLQSHTIEHFPELDRFTVTERDGVYHLDNMTKTGISQSFTDLVFHGGPGSTLEMRIFAESAVLQHCRAAGFQSITVHRRPDFQHGIWWPEPWSFPITAKKGDHH